MANSNIAGYDIEKDPFAPSLLHDLTPEGEADITASASVDNTSGTPSAVVTRTKPSASTYNFNFAFSGIKGEQGLQGEQGIQGERGLRGLQGEQGVQGNPGAQGPQGIQGVGISGISYIGDDANGNAVYRITLTNNATYDFTAYKGPQGEKGDQGLPGTGEDGVGISDISYTSTDTDGNNIYTVTLSNNQSYTFTANRGPQGLPGNDGADGITPIISATASVDNTSGTPSVVVTKTGTTDAPTFDFAFTGLKGADASGGSVISFNKNVSSSIEYMTNFNVSASSSNNGVKFPITSDTAASYTLDKNIESGDDIKISSFYAESSAAADGLLKSNLSYASFDCNDLLRASLVVTIDTTEYYCTAYVKVENNNNNNIVKMFMPETHLTASADYASGTTVSFNFWLPSTFYTYAYPKAWILSGSSAGSITVDPNGFLITHTLSIPIRMEY